MGRLTRDGTAEPVSRDQILRHARGQGNIHFSCSADHEQDWQPYPVDPYSLLYVMTIHTYTLPARCVCCWMLLHSASTISTAEIGQVVDARTRTSRIRRTAPWGVAPSSSVRLGQWPAALGLF